MRTDAPTRPAALLWDFDGTLVDTMACWHRAEVRLMRDWGAEWSDQQAIDIYGLSTLEMIVIMATHAGRDVDTDAAADVMNAYVLEDMERAGVPWRPGASELLRAAKKDGVPCALVSATYTSVLEQLVATMMEGLFALVIGGDSVANGKPAPDPYELAARRLGLAPSDCLAIEDSYFGLDSAEAAGCTTLAIPFKSPLEEAPGRIIVPTLEGLSLDDVAALWREARGAA